MRYATFAIRKGKPISQVEEDIRKVVTFLGADALVEEVRFEAYFDPATLDDVLTVRIETEVMQ